MSALHYALSVLSAILSGMSVKIAEEITGGLSSPSKMPCRGYSIPASKCKVGMWLAKIPGSTCYSCYASDSAHPAATRHTFKNGRPRVTRYATLVVMAATERRYASLGDPRWVAAMAYLIQVQSPKYFRWHDSGDIQSLEHLENIMSVVALTPLTRHWIPTREYGIIRAFVREYGAHPCDILPNLIIRESAHMLNSRAPKGARWSSRVHTRPIPINGWVRVCPAPKQDGECGNCRMCWSRHVPAISYAKH